MSFNAVEYSEAFDNFILKAESISDFNDPRISEALADICRVLRIANVSVIFYETAGHEEGGKGNTRVFFSDGKADDKRVFTVRENTGGGNVAIYRMMQYADDSDWTDEERSKLVILEKALFAFNGRSRVMHMIDKLIFTDEGMGIPNLRFFMKTVGELIGRGQIDKYGTCYFNLKRFSVINQNIGRDRGTMVMKKFIFGLQEKLSEGEYVCRVGGDNFVVIFKKENIDTVCIYLSGTGIVYNEEDNERVYVSAYAGYTI